MIIEAQGPNQWVREECPAFPWNVFAAVWGEVCSRFSGLLTSTGLFLARAPLSTSWPTVGAWPWGFPRQGKQSGDARLAGRAMERDTRSQGHSASLTVGFTRNMSRARRGPGIPHSASSLQGPAAEHNLLLFFAV